MTRLTTGEEESEATLNKRAPFLTAIDAVLAAPTVEAAFAAVEAVAASEAAASRSPAPAPVVASASSKGADKTSPAAAEGAPTAETETRSSMGALFATVAAWPAKPNAVDVSPPATAKPAPVETAEAVAAAEAKAAARAKKYPLEGVPGPLVKGLARACLEVPFGLAWWGPAFCVRPLVLGSIGELVKTDAKLVSFHLKNRDET